MLVYKFLEERWALENVTRQRLKVTLFSDLNDPFEVLGPYLRDRAIRRAYKSWRSKVLPHLGMLCFSKGWRSSPVLWSHYADKHRGICLGFEVPADRLVKVDYVKNRLTLDPGELQDGCIPAEPLRKQIFRTKWKQWEYEQEWREVFRLEQAQRDGAHYFRPFGDHLRLRQVIVRHDCNCGEAVLRRAICSDSTQVVLIKARLSFGKFEVTRQNQGFGSRSSPS